MTVLSERMDVITAIGNLTHNTVSGSLATQSIAGEALAQFTLLLNQETNETMIVHATAELGKWMRVSSANLPSALTDRMRVSLNPSSLAQRSNLLLLPFFAAVVPFFAAVVH